MRLCGDFTDEQFERVYDMVMEQRGDDMGDLEPYIDEYADFARSFINDVKP